MRRRHALRCGRGVATFMSGRESRGRRLRLEPLEERALLSVDLHWAPGSDLALTENIAGATPAITISEPSPNVSLLKIDLGPGRVFAGTSTGSAVGLTYQNPGSPATSRWAAIDISLTNNATALQVALPGDGLAIGPIRDALGGVGSITASAATIDVLGVNTYNANACNGGNVDLRATDNLTVDSGVIVQTGGGMLSLAADVQADGTGDDGVGTLSIAAGATVTSTNVSGSAITLRGADINIDTSANPAVVGAERVLGTTPSVAATITGLTQPRGLAFDADGNLYVSNYGTNGLVTKFPPGSITSSGTLLGTAGATALAFDGGGNLYVLDNAGASKFAPGATTPSATLSGTYWPSSLAIDARGDVFIGNVAVSSVTEFAAGSSVPTASLNSITYADALAFDGSGVLNAASQPCGIVSQFAPGSTLPTNTLTGLNDPVSALAIDGAGNVYVGNGYANQSGDEYDSQVSKFAPGSTTPSATLTGVIWPVAMAFDGNGYLYVVNSSGASVSVFAPGRTTPTTILSGLNGPSALAFDNSGNLYVANRSGNTVCKYIPVGITPTAGGVVICSSLPTRPMSLGGTNAAVAGVNLTDAELARIQTTATGMVTVGDIGQTGNITFTTATVATTAGASTLAVQAAAAGQVVLDDGAGAGTALNGNGGAITLNAGAGGIAALSANNATAEIGTTGSAATSVTLNSIGPIGTSANRIQFADNAFTTQQNVVVGQIGTFYEPSSVFLDGLGSLTLGDMQGDVVNTLIDVTARNNLTVAAGAQINSGTSTLSLGADLKADGTGDNGVGTLSINAGATVTSSNPTASAITLRGADINIDTSANPAVVGGQRSLSTTPGATLTGLSFPKAVAFDDNGNVYVANVATGANTVSRFAPGCTTPNATLTGLDYPVALACDAQGNLYVSNRGSSGNGTSVSVFAPGSTTPSAALNGLSGPYGLAFDGNGNLYVANSPTITLSKFAPGSTMPTTNLTGLWAPMAVAFDGSGNLFVANYLNNTVSKFAPGSSVPTATLTGLNYPTALACDAQGNLYVCNWGGTPLHGSGTTVSKFAPGSTTATATLTGLNEPGALAFDGSGNLYVANYGFGFNSGTVSQFAPGSTTPDATLTGLGFGGLASTSLAFGANGNLYVANYWGSTVSKFPLGSTATPTAGGVVIRSSLASRPMSLGGTDNAVAGINLTDAELAQIQTAATGTVTIGDSAQTGNITFTTATVATTAGASTVVVQAVAGPGRIILDDAGTGTGLNGNGGTVSLTPGTGGIAAHDSASGVLLATEGFIATGLTLVPTLSFAPTLGTQVTLLNNTATPATSNPIVGTFANLPQGRAITLDYAGTPYTFQVSYAGGDGNDLVLTAEPAATPAIAISQVPTFGQAGNIAGTVSGVDFATHRIAIYIQIEGGGWWTKPTFANPTVAIAPDGTFTAAVVTGGLDAYATIYCAAVVSIGYTPPAASGSVAVPAGLQSQAIVFRDRYTSGPTVQFAGYTWAVKDAPSPVGPGSNLFSTRSDDIWSDANGLHLGIHEHDDTWWSTEAILTQSLGYGTYAFQTAGPLDALDANAVFGAFTWNPYGDNPSPGGGPNEEFDHEASRWGDPLDPLNGQFVVQPWQTAGNRQRYTIPDLGDNDALTWFIRWAPENIAFLLVRGNYATGAFPPDAVIQQWVYQGPVPSPAREAFHFNLWLNAFVPLGGLPSDVIITDFHFAPLAEPPPAPVIAGLANDTGFSNADKVTTDPALGIIGRQIGATLQYSFSTDNGATWSAWGANTPPVTGPTTNVSVIVRQTDMAGNISPPSTAPFSYWFDAPAVTSEYPNMTTVTTGQVGSTFIVTVFYNEDMDPSGSNFPTVTFSPDVGSTLGTPNGQWVTPTRFEADYAVESAGVYAPHVHIAVAGGMDSYGNVPAPFQSGDDFAINTQVTPPTVVYAQASIQRLSLDNIGGTDGFQVHIKYDPADAPLNTMRLASRPTITFVADTPELTAQVNATLIPDLANSTWSGSGSDYIAYYNVVNTGAVVPNVDMKIAGAQGAYSSLTEEWYDQARFLASGAFSIDVTHIQPLVPVESTWGTYQLVTNAAAAQPQPSYWVRINYAHPMSIGIQPTVTLSGNTPAETASIQSVMHFSYGTWTSTQNYMAYYTVNGATDVPMTGVYVAVEGAHDLIGNLQVPYLSPSPVFNVDTHDATPALSSVTNLGSSMSSVTAGQVGSQMYIEIVYSQTMDISSSPTIQFLDSAGNPTGVPGATVYENYAASYWGSDQVYWAWFDIQNPYASQTPAGIMIPKVGVQVSDARDITGRAQTPYQQSFVFDIDTLSPDVGHLPICASVSPNLSVITDANTGPDKFLVRIDYDRPMWAGVGPVIGFVPDPTTPANIAALAHTLTADPDSSGWGNYDPATHGYWTFWAWYNVNMPDDGESIPYVGIKIKGAVDTAGHPQSWFEGSGFSISMLDDALPLTGAGQTSNPTYTDAALGAAAFNPTVALSPAATDQKSAALTAADYALLYSGTWLEA